MTWADEMHARNLRLPDDLHGEALAYLIGFAGEPLEFGAGDVLRGVHATIRHAIGQALDYAECRAIDGARR